VTATLKSEEKGLRLSLRGRAARIPLPELKAAVNASVEQKTGMLERLNKLQSGEVKPVSVEDRQSVEQERRKWEKIANVRKKIRRDMWKAIEGTMEKDQAAQLKEDLDLTL
jgi:26S proteasome regulatory subunit, ATPase 3, interacting protein